MGEACDPGNLSADCGTTGICNESMAAMDDVPATYACEAAMQACPAGWDPIDLADHAAAGGWSYQGNTADNENNTQGTCVDANGPEGVAMLTSANGGFYVCDVDADGEDTVMYVRSFCGEEAAGAELACNDDAEEGDIGFQSRVRFYVAPGRSAYIFVDGFGGAEFAYTLNCAVDSGDADDQ